MVFGFGRSRLESCLQLSKRFTALLEAISSNVYEMPKAQLIANDMQVFYKTVHKNDFTILRNQFLLSLHANCADRLALARSFDEVRMDVHNTKALELLHGWSYNDHNMEEVFKLPTVPIPPMEKPEAAQPADAQSSSHKQQQANADAPSSTSKRGKHPELLLKPEWRLPYQSLNVAFFGGQLVQPKSITWKDLPVLSQHSTEFTDQGIQYNVALHYKLSTSPACLAILLHEMTHIWDETTWKPVEAQWAPFGHGYYWASKIEHIQLSLKYAKISWLINVTDQIPAPPPPEAPSQRHLPPQMGGASAAARQQPQRFPAAGPAGGGRGPAMGPGGPGRQPSPSRLPPPEPGEGPPPGFLGQPRQAKPKLRTYGPEVPMVQRAEGQKAIKSGRFAIEPPATSAPPQQPQPSTPTA